MAIWFDVDPLTAGPAANPSMVTHLGIEVIEAGDDFLRARMPVDDRTRQPYGLLHGGASVALAETIASLGAHYVVDRSRCQVVGIEINANHLRGVRDGWVTATARPLHIGRTTQVWDIRIEDDRGRPVCVSRCTVGVIAAA